MVKAASRRRGSFSSIDAIDPSAMIGFVAAFGFIAAAIASGGMAQAFVNWPSVLLVICGTFAATLISFPFREFVAAPKAIVEALSFRPQPQAHGMAIDCVELAERVRGYGMMALSAEADRQRDKPILRRGLTMLSDGMPATLISVALRREIATILDAGEIGQNVLRRAAELAPAMGLIGTLVGLVQMLRQLEDPASIGPSMALALLTTLYGAILAHAALTPLAERLARRNDKAADLLEIQLLTVMSLEADENPRILETKLNGVLPAHAQLAIFD